MPKPYAFPPEPHRTISPSPEAPVDDDSGQADTTEQAPGEDQDSA